MSEGILKQVASVTRKAFRFMRIFSLRKSERELISSARSENLFDKTYVNGGAKTSHGAA